MIRLPAHRPNGFHTGMLIPIGRRIEMVDIDTKWEMYRQYTGIPKKNTVPLGKEYHIAQTMVSKYMIECRNITNIAALIRVLLREMQSDQIKPEEWRSLEELLNLCRVNGIEPSEGIQ